MTADITELRFFVDQGFMEKLERVKARRAHVNPFGELKCLFEGLLDQELRKEKRSEEKGRRLLESELSSESKVGETQEFDEIVVSSAQLAAAKQIGFSRIPAAGVILDSAEIPATYTHLR